MLRFVRILAAVAALVPAAVSAQPAPASIPLTVVTGGLDGQPLGIAQAVCEGLALGEAFGLAPERLVPTLQAGAAGCWFLDKRGLTMLADEFAPGFKLGLLHKDLRIVRELAEEAGVDHAIVDLSLAQYGELIARGRADEDTSALIRLKRPAVAER